MNVRQYNRHAWDRQVEKGNRWTVPVGPDVIAAARRGAWHIILTPTKPVPAAWFPALAGLDVLRAAAGRRAAGGVHEPGAVPVRRRGGGPRRPGGPPRAPILRRDQSHG